MPSALKGRPALVGFEASVKHLHSIYRRAGGTRAFTARSDGKLENGCHGEHIFFVVALLNQMAPLLPQGRLPQPKKRMDFVEQIIRDSQGRKRIRQGLE
jgi:hypothetical protein